MICETLDIYPEHFFHLINPQDIMNNMFLGQVFLQNLFVLLECTLIVLNLNDTICNACHFACRLVFH